MNIHEYQAKATCSRAWRRRWRAAYPPSRSDEAVKAAGGLGGPVWVVKAQIHAGGRGKGKFKGRRPAKRAESARRGR